MPAAVGSVAPGFLGSGGGGVGRGRVLVEMGCAGVLHLRRVHHVLSVVGQLDVSLQTITLLGGRSVGLNCQQSNV